MDQDSLTQEEAREVMFQIMSGEYDDAQIAGFLIALRAKGETSTEIAGFAQAMRDKMTKIECVDDAIDMCGTGGDASGTFNISTASTFVVAGAGVPVAKHGNRSMTSKSGSADVLTALGVDITLPPETVSTCIEKIGIGFMFAPSLHPAMKYAMGARVIEKHYTFDKTIQGGDHLHSMDEDDLSRLTSNIAFVNSLFGSELKEPLASEDLARMNARRSIVIQYKLGKGDTIKEKDITIL